MQVLWTVGRGFVKDLLENYPDPKPHYNSVATMVKILEEKGFLNHESVGNMLLYFPVIQKEDYQNFALKDVVSQYFDNSYPRMLAYFAKEQNLTEEELKEIMSLIKTKKS